MAKIKLTKNELKSQRDSLKRFQRYLPTLTLKKQQLQMEVRKAHEKIKELQEQENQRRSEIEKWIKIVDEKYCEQLLGLVKVASWEVGIRNVAGTDTPIFKSISFETKTYDLYSTPIWFDDLIDALKMLVEYKLKHQLMREQLQLLEYELRVITQRVNLFEKVKIPESQENIRHIQIYLGDQQTNAVGRAKIAKEKCKAKVARMCLS